MNDLRGGRATHDRNLKRFARGFIAFQWWAVPALPAEWTEKWLRSLDTTRWFPLWFRVLVPLLVFMPWNRLAVFGVRIPFRIPNLLHVLLLAASGGFVFWCLRIGRLELGDSRLIDDHFTSLTTYASVREPLESILHTEFARLLFFGWGIHPKTCFMIQSCLLGVATLALGGWALSTWKGNRVPPSLVLCLFLVGPIHLFFGYIEWYTQLAMGLIVFQIFSLRTIFSGLGLGWALSGLLFAACSHLVGLAFVPAAFVLIAIVRKGRDAFRISLGFALALLLALAATISVLSFRIRLDASLENTRTLFSLLMPLMREDNPANPPGSWTYPWLSANHLADLANEILLCGLFPLLLWVGALKGGEGKGIESTEDRNLEKNLFGFYFSQLVPCALFLLVWNPWLGFPGDWDLYSFFAWPLLSGCALYGWSRTAPDRRLGLFAWAAVPAFSMVFAWVVAYHRGTLPDWRDVFARKDRAYYDRILAAAKADTAERDWSGAYEKVDRILRESPDRIAECYAVFDFASIQRMSEDWGPLDRLCPLAVDFEIVAASPHTRLLVLDVWGRVFFWEGGYFNDWDYVGLPDAPNERAVDMEIAPWIPAGIILTEKGDLYRFPIPSWVDPNPPADSPRSTHVLPPTSDRSLVPIGNFYRDFSKRPLGRGQRAVDLIVDDERKRFVVLDTAGDLQAEGEEDEFQVDFLTALARVDAEFDPRTKGCYTVDWFSRVNLWPGRAAPMTPPHEFYWHAVTDMEVGFDGADLYILDSQGGIVSVSEFGNPQIDTQNLKHFHPTGVPSELTPYIMQMGVLFIDLELVPGQKAFYKMAKNFGIYYSVEEEHAKTP